MIRYDGVVFVLVTEKRLTDGGGNSMTAGRDAERTGGDGGVSRRRRESFLAALDRR
jgi:hypothetical protein